jgi:hypothetical protein
MSLRHHSMIAVIPSLAILMADTAWTQETDLYTPVSTGIPSNERLYSAAGLIRILEDVRDPLAASSSASSEDPKLGSAERKSANEATDSAESLTAAASPALKPAEQNREIIALTSIATPNTNLEGIGTGIRPEDVTVGRLPPPQWLPTGATREGMWPLYSKPWVPGGFCHQPLYWEDPMLERHGHERNPHLQPFYSGIRFFGTFPVLPYLATLRHPLDEVHTLGAYRPGSCAPMLRYRAHYDPEALRNEVLSSGAVVTGVAP